MEKVIWKLDNFEGSSVDTSKFHINNLKIYAPGRVAEGGRLSANAKNAFNSFVGRIFANLRQKKAFLRALPKLQQKTLFLRVFVNTWGTLFFIFLEC